MNSDILYILLLELSETGRPIGIFFFGGGVSTNLEL